MTRQWLNVPPAVICTEHVKRELSETRQLVAIARGEWDVPNWVGDGSSAYSKLLSHATDGQIDTRRIADRWPLLWDALDARGETLAIDRQPPAWPAILPHIHAGEPAREANERDLAARCVKCAARQAAQEFEQRLNEVFPEREIRAGEEFEVAG